MAYVLRGWGPELTLAISLPLPHIPGSLYTRTFTPEGLKSVAVLPLYSWNFVTVVCPGCPSAEPTQTSLFLWRQLPKPAVVTSSAPCLPAPSPLHGQLWYRNTVLGGGPGRGRGAGGRVHARPPACLLRTADCLAWGGAGESPLGATMGPVLGRASGQGGEVCTVGPGRDPYPHPPKLQGTGDQLSRGGGEGAQWGCQPEVRGGCPGLPGSRGGLGQGGEAISLVCVRQEDAH